MDRLDVDDDAAVALAVDEIKKRILREKWIPYSHRAITEGATHLPKRKFGWRLFMSEGGLMGRPDYKSHFFGDTNLIDLTLFMLKERFRYSKTRIGIAHRLARQNAL